MSATATAPAGHAAGAAVKGYNQWIIALTVTLATFMEVLDTSIANVALPHIAGGLGAAKSQATWVLTSYLVANAIVLPISGWLIGLIGRKRFYMSCVFLFTVSSALCGAAPNLELLIFFRVLQGIGGGGLQPSEQGILVDTFPVQQRGMAMAIYGVAVVVAPILGPTLGGWITDNYSWRWIFYINVPIGVFSLIMTSIVVQDPPGMEAERKANRKRGLGVDYIGLSLATLGLGALEVIYAKGQEWNWIGDPFYRAQGFMALTVVGLVCFVVWELRHPNPIVNLRLLGERNFLCTGLLIYITFAVLYGANANLPLMLQELYGYDATRAGFILSPGAFFTMAVMPLVGYLLGKKVDARWLIPVGVLSVAGASYWQSVTTFQSSPMAFILPRCLQMFGVGFLFVPLNNAAYLYVAKNQINNATGVFNMMRNEGGSLGIAVSTILVERRAQFHQSRLVEHVKASRPQVDAMIKSLASRASAALGSSPTTASDQGLVLLYRTVTRQARLMAYLDVFVAFALMMMVALPLVFLMKRSVAEGKATMH